MFKKKRHLREKTNAHGATKLSIMSAGNQPGELIGGFGQSNAAPDGFKTVRYLKTHGWAIGLIAFFSLGAVGAGLKYLEDDARRQMPGGKLKTENRNNQSFLNWLNPFIPSPDPTPTPQLAREYLYAGGGRLLAVEDANASAAPPSDLAVWRPSDGVWWVMGESTVLRAAQQWGLNGDIPLPGDYDGDGKTDFCVFRPSASTWYILHSSTGVISGIPFGITGDTPEPADFDGDGKTDVAVFRKDVPSAGIGTWYILKSSDSGFLSIAFGVNSDADTLAPADYDGDGRADVTVWRDSTKSFYSLRSSDGMFQTVTFAENSSQPVVGDYDGDGRSDYAIRTGANWIILNSSTNQTQTTAWQQSGDRAVPNDYDGDGKVDIAVWRDATGDWYIKNSSTGQQRYEHWGQTGDIPVPVFYRR